MPWPAEPLSRRAARSWRLKLDRAVNGDRVRYGRVVKLLPGYTRRTCEFPFVARGLVFLNDEIDRPFAPEFRHAGPNPVPDVERVVRHQVPDGGDVAWRLVLDAEFARVKNPHSLVIALIVDIKDVRKQQQPSFARPRSVPDRRWKIGAGDLRQEMQGRAGGIARPFRPLWHHRQPAQPGSRLFFETDGHLAAQDNGSPHVRVARLSPTFPKEHHKIPRRCFAELTLAISSLDFVETRASACSVWCRPTLLARRRVTASWSRCQCVASLSGQRSRCANLPRLMFLFKQGC
jgi:hypothetical protein